jgi:hypothetical protein
MHKSMYIYSAYPVHTHANGYTQFVLLYMHATPGLHVLCLPTCPCTLLPSVPGIVTTMVTSVHPNSILRVWANHFYNKWNGTFKGY